MTKVPNDVNYQRSLEEIFTTFVVYAYDSCHTNAAIFDRSVLSQDTGDPNKFVPGAVYKKESVSTTWKRVLALKPSIGWFPGTV